MIQAFKWPEKILCSYLDPKLPEGTSWQMFGSNSVGSMILRHYIYELKSFQEAFASNPNLGEKFVYISELLEVIKNNPSLNS